MARIRLSSSTPSNVPTPPLGRANLFYDDTDKSFKAKLSDNSIIILSASDEYIQDIVGNLFINSSTIEVFYDDLANSTTLNIKSDSITDTYVNKISPTKITDNNNGRYEASLITNNDNPSNIFSLDCSMDGCWLVELKLTARRLGGLAGSAGDGGSFRRTFRIKSIASSVTIHDYQSDYTSKDNSTMNVLTDVDGTNVIVKVIGAINNNFKWNASIMTSINV